jgi:putative addiction module component (TIGR02574 family)
MVDGGRSIPGRCLRLSVYIQCDVACLGESAVGSRELIEAALKLDPTERLALVDQVLHSLDQPDPTIDRIWIEEAERRLAEYRAGRARGVPAEDVLGPL